MNLNTPVRVRLTEHGRKVEKKALQTLFSGRMNKHDAERLVLRCTYTPDKSGYTRWMLWELMNVFGPEMLNGNPNMCFENNEIQIEGIQ
jgi:hypothetical protein